MNTALVIGHATSTVKHASLKGWRLLIVQPLTVDGGNDGDPLLAIDELGAKVGKKVLISSEGKAVQEAMKSKQSPVRWMVIAQPDEE